MVESRRDNFNVSDPLLETTKKIIRAENHDVCIENVCALNKVNVESVPENILLFGAQGELAQPMYYGRSVWEAELKWMQKKQGLSSSDKQILRIFYGVTHSINTSKMCSDIAMARLNEQWIQRIKNKNVRGLYCLDLLYAQSTLNRYWPGAKGIYDGKTPLLNYHYVKNGFGQSIQSKLDSTFIRNVVDQAMPAWRDIPFTHEYPENISKAFPTYWDMGKGEEIVDLVHSEHRALRYFDIDNMREISAELLDPEIRQQLDVPFLMNSFIDVQRVLWSIAFYEETAELNQAIVRLQNEG